MDLKPLLVNRVLNAVGWLLIISLPIGALLESELSGKVLGAVLFGVLGVFLAVRGYRAGASYGADEIVIRGFIYSRRIPKVRITQITEFPAVRWTREDGKARWSPIFAFYTGGQVIPSVERHNAVMIQRLQDWDDRRRLVARRNPVKKRRKRQR